MRQMWAGRRSILQQNKALEDLTAARGSGASRRGVTGLLAVAAAGAVAGPDTLSAAAGAVPRATVTGLVSGPGVTDFSGCVIILSQTNQSSALMTPVNPDGSYAITGVAHGKWAAVCVPGGGIPLGVMTYSSRPGYSAGTIIKVEDSKTVTADFALQPAGALEVIVTNRAGAPVSGAMAWSFEAGSQVPAGIPAVADSSCSATLTNVPLISKVFVIDPATSIAAWWDGAQSWSTATVVTLPAQGVGISITVALPEP
jgi:hypothetical protein